MRGKFEKETANVSKRSVINWQPGRFIVDPSSSEMAALSIRLAQLRCASLGSMRLTCKQNGQVGVRHFQSTDNRCIGWRKEGNCTSVFFWQSRSMQVHMHPQTQ